MASSLDPDHAVSWPMHSTVDFSWSCRDSTPLKIRLQNELYWAPKIEEPKISDHIWNQGEFWIWRDSSVKSLGWSLFPGIPLIKSTRIGSDQKPIEFNEKIPFNFNKLWIRPMLPKNMTKGCIGATMQTICDWNAFLRWWAPPLAGYAGLRAIVHQWQNTVFWRLWTNIWPTHLRTWNKNICLHLFCLF